MKKKLYICHNLLQKVMEKVLNNKNIRFMQAEIKDLIKDKLPISVDFDATLCYPHAYPNIMYENKPCFDVLKKWQNMGCMIILNTMRGGEKLKEAIEWCKQFDFTFDAIGRNPTQDTWCGSDVYKVYSILDIDDRNAGVFLLGEEVDGRGWVDWNKIDEIYTPKIKKWLNIIE